MSSDNVENLPQNSSVPVVPSETSDSVTEGPAGPDGAEPASSDAGTAITVELEGLSSLEELWGLEMCLVPEDQFAEGPTETMWDWWGTTVPIELPRRAHVEPGEYRLVVARDRQDPIVVPVTVGTKPQVVNVPLPPLDRTRVALIEVQTDEGIPIDGVDLQLRAIFLGDTYRTWRSSHPPLRIGPGQFLISADESWRVEHPDRGVRGYQVTASIFEQSHSARTIELGHSEPISITFETRVPLYLSIQEFDNPDITPPRFISWGRGLDPTAWATLNPDLGGYARARIAPGDYTFALGGGPDHRSFAQIGPDGAQIPLAPPRLSRLRVTVDPSIAEPGTWFELHGPRGKLGRQRLGPRRVLDFGALAADVVSLSVDGGRGMQIALPVDRPVPFTPGAPTAFQIQTIRPEWSARFGLVVGDRVTAIDGHPAGHFETAYAAHASLPFARSITIERQGATLRIDLPAGEPHLVTPPKLRPLFGEVR